MWTRVLWVQGKALLARVSLSISLLPLALTINSTGFSGASEFSFNLKQSTETKWPESVFLLNVFFISYFFFQVHKNTYLFYVFRQRKPWRQYGKAWEAKSTRTEVITRSRFCSIAVLYRNYEAFLQIEFIGKLLSPFHYCIDSTRGYQHPVWGSQTVTMVSLIYISDRWNYQIIYAHLLKWFMLKLRYMIVSSLTFY